MEKEKAAPKRSKQGKQEKEPLREGKATIQALIDATSESAMLIDSKGTVLTINEIAAQRLGKSKNGIIGQIVYNFMSPEVSKKRSEKVKEVFNADAALIRLRDDEVNELVLVAHLGFPQSEIKKIVPRRKFGTGACWQCVQSGKPAIKKKARKGSSILHKNGYQSSYIIPLKSKDRIVGTMGVQQRTPRDLLPEDIDLFTNIGNQIGVAIENATLFSKLQQRTEALSALNSVSQTVNQTLELDRVLQDALGRVIDVLKADAGLIRLLDEDRQELVLKTHQGFTSQQIKGGTQKEAW